MTTANTRHRHSYRTLVISSLCLLACAAITWAAGTPGMGTASGEYIHPQGANVVTGFGDFISSTNGSGLDRVYRFYAEVPAGLGTLTIELYDADVGTGTVDANGGESDGRDRHRDGGFTTCTRYRVEEPDGTEVANELVGDPDPIHECTDSGSSPLAPTAADGGDWDTCDDAFCTLYTVASPDAGHWLIEIDLTSAVNSTSSGEARDNNGFGLRVHDGTAGAGGTEIPVYSEDYYMVGLNPGNGDNTWTVYPYIDAGGDVTLSDFDWDSTNTFPGGSADQSLVLSTRDGATTFTFLNAVLSANDVWVDHPITFTNDLLCAEYGIWELDIQIEEFLSGGNANQGNYGVVLLSDFSYSGQPPGASEPAFRLYLPTDADAAPIRPHLEQSWTTTSNAPVRIGETTRVEVTVTFTNPTGSPGDVEFGDDATDVIRAVVPNDTQVAFVAASETCSTGTVTQTGTGPWTITCDPGVVSAGSTVTMTYELDLTPTAAGAIELTSAPGTGDGTTATFIDTTCSDSLTDADVGGNCPSISRSRFEFGEICPLQADVQLSSPVLISSVRALAAENGGVELEWKTVAEAETVGFEVYRATETGTVRVGQGPLMALLDSPHGGVYRLLDSAVTPRDGELRYQIVELDANGSRRAHGPYVVTADQPSDGALAIDGLTAFSSTPYPPTDAYLDRLAAADSAVLSGPAPAGEALMIGIREAGLYRVDANDIATALGLDTTAMAGLLASHSFSLRDRNDSEVAWQVAESGDALEFYGVGIDSAFTRDNVYRLTAGNGIAMTTANERPWHRYAVLPSFRDTIRMEEDDRPITLAPIDPESDIFFWDFAAAGNGPVDFAVDTPTPLAGTDASLTVDVFGATATTHNVSVSLNGTQLGTIDIDGFARQSKTFAVASGVLLESNIITVEATSGFVAVDGFDVEYDRRRFAVSDQLHTDPAGFDYLQAFGFSTSDLRVYDLSNPLQPVRIPVSAVASRQPGQFQVVTQIDSPNAEHLVVAASAIKTPATLRTDFASDLLAGHHDAEYLVITSASLAASAQALADRRGAEGMTTLVVDVVDIYDELNGGVSDPREIGAFLAHASSTWQGPPRYVLIAGAGTWDYRDDLGMGGNLIPPVRVAGEGSIFASDTPLADFDDDGRPDVAIGRVPALTGAEIDAYVAKLDLYENAAQPAWASELLLIADDPDDGGPFGSDMTRFRDTSTERFTTTSIDLATAEVGAARQTLFDALDQGVGLLNFYGHGGVTNITDEMLFTSADVATLANVGRTPIVTAVSCHIGMFGLPLADSLGEDLVLADEAGAIAVWAPVWLSTHGYAESMGETFLRGLLHGDRLGDALVAAYHSGSAGSLPTWLLEVYQLLGDPALKIQLAPTPQAPGPEGPENQG